MTAEGRTPPGRDEASERAARVVGGSHAWRSRAGGRAVLLAVAAASAGVVVATLATRGVGYVNLDSLLQEPVRFSASVLLPAALTLACILASTLPRIVMINVMVFASLLVAAEAGTWALQPAPPTIRGEPEAIGAPAFYVPAPALGYALAPSITARHRRTEGDKAIYDVTYEIDERERRYTPTTLDAPRGSFLLFFGDSNTFGEGLAQTQTLPYYAGELAPRYRPYNYGVPGYGPAQLLILAHRDNLERNIEERDGYAVFFLIPAHVARVVGSTQVSTGWGRHFPYYTLGAGGAVIDNGDFAHGRPLTTLAYFFFAKSNVAQYFGVDLPLRYTSDDYRLTAAILAESGRLLTQRMHLRGFAVILGQVFNDAQLRVIQGVRDALARDGVRYLDYTGLYAANDPQYRLSDYDYHNSAKANRVIAARLVADLGIER
jgi:hypothetical protein